MKWFCEIIQDSDGTYCAKMTDEEGVVEGLPENVDYLTLKEAIMKKTGRIIVRQKDLKFKRFGRLRYAFINACCYCEEGACITYSMANLAKLRAALSNKEN